jgi:hypothetical protein
LRTIAAGFGAYVVIQVVGSNTKNAFEACVLNFKISKSSNKMCKYG